MSYLRYLCLFVGVLMSYLRYLCLLGVYSGVQHILCCVFYLICLHLLSCVPNVPSFPGLNCSFIWCLSSIFCLVYPMFPVSLDWIVPLYDVCPPSFVLCTQCSQFPWIELFLYGVCPLSIVCWHFRFQYFPQKLGYYMTSSHFVLILHEAAYLMKVTPKVCFVH